MPPRVITFKVEKEARLNDLPLKSLTYALTLTHAIQIQVELHNLRFAKKVYAKINLILVELKKNVHFDLIVICEYGFTKSGFGDYLALKDKLELPVRNQSFVESEPLNELKPFLKLS
jgi:hypothetical protein